MEHSHHDSHAIRNPGPWSPPQYVWVIFLLMLAVGGCVTGYVISTDPARGWSSFLLNHFYFMSLALGGIFISAIQFLTGAMWSAPIRRISESFTAYLPWVLLTFAVLVFGMHDLYVWTHPDHVQGDVILEHKAGYLNTTFFVIRNVIAIGGWYFFIRKIIGNSLAQDKLGAIATEKNKVLAPLFLIFFALSYTMASFDQLMSLDPHWFSTMFGVYCFAGLFYSSLALTAIIAVLLRKQGILKGIVNDDHLHDLGKFMFAFAIFWAYIAISQYLLIWYANLPEETLYLTLRTEGPWEKVATFLLLGKFLVPFFALLPRAAKRSENRLLFVGIWMLFAQWVDLIWLIQPEFFKDGPRFLWEAFGFIGFAGFFGLVVTRFLSRNNVVAIGDPKLAESVHHHHQ